MGPRCNVSDFVVCIDCLFGFGVNLDGMEKSGPQCPGDTIKPDWPTKCCLTLLQCPDFLVGQNLAKLFTSTLSQSLKANGPTNSHDDQDIQKDKLPLGNVSKNWMGF